MCQTELGEKSVALLSLKSLVMTVEFLVVIVESVVNGLVNGLIETFFFLYFLSFKSSSDAVQQSTRVFPMFFILYTIEYIKHEHHTLLEKRTI